MLRNEAPGPCKSVIHSVTVAMVLALVSQFAEAQIPAGPPTEFGRFEWVLPTLINDTKRSFTSLSAQSGWGLTAKLNSHYGFAAGFTVNLSPYKLLVVPPDI